MSEEPDLGRTTLVIPAKIEHLIHRGGIEEAESINHVEVGQVVRGVRASLGGEER